MTMNVFLTLLLAVSILTGLVVEALKKFFDKKLGDEKTYSSNMLAGITAIVLSIIVGVFYCILANVAFSANIIIYLIALMLLSWLSSMVGYDKVIQSLTQIGIVPKK